MRSSSCLSQLLICLASVLGVTLSHSVSHYVRDGVEGSQPTWVAELPIEDPPALLACDGGETAPAESRCSAAGLVPLLGGRLRRPRHLRLLPPGDPLRPGRDPGRPLRRHDPGRLCPPHRQVPRGGGPLPR